MALTESQIYALNSLTYAGFNSEAQSAIGTNTAHNILSDAMAAGDTVSEYVQALRKEFEGKPSKFDSCFDKILSDPDLCNMKIEGYQPMEGSGANMIVFTSDTHSEAVVAFEGSQSTPDWVDNFAVVETPTSEADGVSSEFQVSALDYVNSSKVQKILSRYDTVTTTGHSKGGNNASYCALLSDNVDRAVTFDAPGFSDGFYENYADQIAAKQGSIDNYSADDDIVNALLNSVGRQHYIERNIPANYKNCVDSTKGFDMMLSHDPCAMENFFLNGGSEVRQDPGVAALDRFLNGYLRANPEHADSAFKLVTGLMDGSLLDELGSSDNMIDLIANIGALLKRGGDDIGSLFSYLGEYINTYPEDMDLIINFLGDYYPGIANILTAVTNVVDFFGKPSTSIPNRKDKTVMPTSFPGFGQGIPSVVQGAFKQDQLVFNTETLTALARKLNGVGDQLQSQRGAIRRAAGNCTEVDFHMNLYMRGAYLDALKGGYSGTPDQILRDIANVISKCSDEIDTLSANLRKAAELIEQREKAVAQRANNLKSSQAAPHTDGEGGLLGGIAGTIGSVIGGAAGTVGSVIGGVSAVIGGIGASIIGANTDKPPLPWEKFGGLDVGSFAGAASANGKSYAYADWAGYELSEDNPGVTAWAGRASARAEGDHAYAGVNGYLGKASAEAKADGSFMKKEKKRVKKDGKWTEEESFTVVNAEVGAGASVSAISVDAETGVGDDMFGIGISGEGAVGSAKAEGKAEFSVGTEGVNANVSGEAMVSAVEGEAKGTINILGLEITGKVGGYAGAVGIKGKAGIEDGKFVLEGGLAAVIGGSAGIEIGFNDEGWNNFVDFVTFWD